MLSKPEFGLTALAAGGAALIAGRGPSGAWGRYLLACGVLVAVGFGLQVWSAGVWPVWRGYTGYDQLIGGSARLWGTRLGDKRLLWAAMPSGWLWQPLWAGHRWPRRRLLVVTLAAAGAMAVLAVGLSYLFDITYTMLLALVKGGDASGITVTPVNLLHMVSAPWSPLLPLLLGVGWLARGRSLPVAWWVLWTYAFTSSFRFLFTGYANSFAVAPALAISWVWIEDRLRASPYQLRSIRRVALSVLGGLAIANLLAQLLIPNFLLNGPRAWVATALGPVRIAQTYQVEYEALAAFIDQRVPAGAPIFTTGWGAQWYLLTGHPNPTAFDAVFTGLGASGPDAEDVQHDLALSPPAALVVPNGWLLNADGSPRDVASMSQNLPVWWRTLQQDYVDQTPSELHSWRVLLRQP